MGIVDAVAVGDLVAAQVWIHPRSPGTRPQILLSIYRLRDAPVQNIWHLAIADTKGPESPEDAARDVIRRMVAASNEGDVEAFLALFSPGAKIFRTSDDTQGLADKLSETMSHPKSRRSAITAAFKKGPPRQVQIVGMLTVGDLVVSRDRATLPTGQVINQMKIYRGRNGLITHDWTAHKQTR